MISPQPPRHVRTTRRYYNILIGSGSAGLGLTITQAAEALGVTRNTLSELVNERRGISPEMAVRLSKVFGGSDEGWLIQQAQYDLAQVRRDRLKLKRLEIA
jgi:addiction module HigA family antidote